MGCLVSQHETARGGSWTESLHVSEQVGCISFIGPGCYGRMGGGGGWESAFVASYVGW